MKRTRTTFAVTLLITALCAAAFGREETLEQLKARAEATRAEDRAPLYAEIAKRNVTLGIDFYAKSNGDAARATLEDAATFSGKAADAAVAAHKHLKDTEIHIRQLAHRLNDLKRSLTVEDQPSVQSVIDRMEQMRTRLLEAMFKKEK